MTDAQFESAYAALVADVASATDMEAAIAGRNPPKQSKQLRTRTRARSRAAPDGGKRAGKQAVHASTPRSAEEIARSVLQACVEQRNRAPPDPGPDLSDEALSQYAKWTDKFALKPYARFLWYVPRLVNVVTVRAAALTRSVTRADAGVPRSSPRPSPSRARASRCRSTCTTSPRAAATVTT